MFSKHTEITLNSDLLEKTVEYTMFNNLQKLENKHGFREAKELNFFNTGKTDSWKKILNKAQVKKIEDNFYKEMIELGYL